MREKFQLALKDLPVTLTQAEIWKDRKLVPSFSEMDIKDHKIIHMPDKTHKLIGFFEHYYEMREAHNLPITWQGSNLKFIDHATLALGYSTTRRSFKKDVKNSSVNSTSTKGGRKSVKQTPPVSKPKVASPATKEKENPPKKKTK